MEADVSKVNPLVIQNGHLAQACSNPATRWVRDRRNEKGIARWLEREISGPQRSGGFALQPGLCGGEKSRHMAGSSQRRGAAARGIAVPKKSEPATCSSELIVPSQGNDHDVSPQLLRVRDHEHPLCTMMSCVWMYLRAAISFRACPAVLGVLKQSLSGLNRIPAASTVQSSVLRIGVHELIRTRQQSEKG